MKNARKQTGIALLVVMMLAAIIIPFAAEFAYQIALEYTTAFNVSDQLAIDNAIESQYQIVLARLQHDGQGNQTDTYDDPWNDDELRSRTDDDTGVSLSTTMFDEQGKFNVHILAEASAQRKPVWQVALSVAITGLIGVYHAGVEWKFWPGPSSCTGGGMDLGAMSGSDLLSTSAPSGLVMCDDIVWQLFGLSMAGWNAVICAILLAFWVSAARTPR